MGKNNIVEQDIFRESLERVFKEVSTSLERTLGPYGSTTILSNYGQIHVTKDGWQVIKQISYDDRLDNDIMMMIFRIASDVVAKVGDGSTSSIIVANSTVEEFSKNKNLLGMRPRDFVAELEKVTEIICDHIYNSASQIDKDSFDDIYRLAYISTNGDETISNMIKDIYKETNNPTIEYLESKTNDTNYTITDGYSFKSGGLLDRIYMNTDNGECIIDKPFILMFNHRADKKTAAPIISAVLSNYTLKHNRQLVVMATDYDRPMLEYIRQAAVLERKTNAPNSTVYCRVSLYNDATSKSYNDMAMMVGVTPVYDNTYDVINFSEYTDPETEEVIPATNLAEFIEPYIGECGSIVIRDNSITVKGFYHRDERLYQAALIDATNEYDKVQANFINNGIVDFKINDAKNRLAKLKGRIGTINVGGNTKLAKMANLDLVEDAIKACESAYVHGYNIAGNLAVPKIIDKLLSQNELSDSAKKIVHILSSAYLSSFDKIIKNKDPEITDVELSDIHSKVINESEYSIGYDVVTDMLSADIINSCMTDIQILRASISFVSLLLSSNQYISVDIK